MWIARELHDASVTVLLFSAKQVTSPKITRGAEQVK